MARAFLGLGSNLGDRAALLGRAVESLALAEGVAVVAVSDVYETDPVGGPEQERYLNLVVEVDATIGARGLLTLAQQMEAQAERVRRERWGPRTLDVAVLWVDGDVVDEPDLTVPHPRMWERRFVLAPLSELAPELLPDGWEEAAVGEVTRVGPLPDRPRPI
jgi:2-amino-4-hydroxy-6-hydroxymethyldihydropteridine diphosphokinase